jgi:hypothetical protein
LDRWRTLDASAAIAPASEGVDDDLCNPPVVPITGFGMLQGRWESPSREIVDYLAGEVINRHVGA